ncbi:Smr/MutS family protein [Hyphomicrobium sulfonivorans]|uniref:Smr/MutS family protein n=1 Tax=Hyphomicrobium sulfonivorans TaxID=121290 RepID=UPI00156FF044|nr:Smr/MutS family protein [Hyphomicrobium sulfonivorans]MBI1648492.1 Smr/MutS family protein [Hyphomicrobium sulfonivorans]NSL70970.1 DNA mismatch repair protein MutS [Hyphomicrobium sulfonivorans]
MADDSEKRPLKKSPWGKKAPARLTTEERALWDYMAQSISPIKGKKQRFHPAVPEDEPPEKDAFPAPAKKAPPGKMVRVTKPTIPSPPHTLITRPPALPTPGPSPLELERRKARKLSSGRIEIEGRIDLHGMRQAEAHSALLRFLHRAYGDGKRWVLVITGKGAPVKTAYDERFDGDGDLRGVLRRNVPRWLAEPDVSPIIIGFTTAAIRHGGEGALYVHLRRRPGMPDI